MLEELFKRFTREKLLLENVSPRTVKFYQQCFTAFKATMGTDLPDRFALNEFIIRLREKGYSAGGINVCIRGMNSFLSWLWRNNHTSEKLRMKELRVEQKIIPTYSTADLKAFLSFRPKKRSEHRIYALVCLLIDTGTRIDECLTLTREEPVRKYPNLQVDSKPKLLNHSEPKFTEEAAMRGVSGAVRLHYLSGLTAE